MFYTVVIFIAILCSVLSSEYKNTTLDPASRQLYNFKLRHKAEGWRTENHQYRVERETTQQEVRKQRKARRSIDGKRSECPLVDQLSSERSVMEDQSQKKDKKRRINFERLIEKTKEILFSTESWEEKFKSLFGCVVQECLELFKAFFKEGDLESIGELTTSEGIPVEIRDTSTTNSDLISNRFYLDSTVHFDRERIPERVVHAKGAGAFGYFEVTHDVSKYTKADVFNEVGKKTPVVVRFSPTLQNLGGSDVARETRGFAVKMYTKEGNLDLLGSNIPVFFFRDALLNPSFFHCFKRNPRTNLVDNNMRWDILTLKPETIHAFLWVLSDYGIPDGYRHMNGYPIHTYVITNNHGDNYYVRFNFTSEQGVKNLFTGEAKEIQSRDLDYFSRDLYNAIENKKYPAWTLLMDVMSEHDIGKLSFNPFDVTRQWRKGSYHTVPIGRMVLNKNPDNFFKTMEQVAFNPHSLVPGIPGPQDQMFRGRHLVYKDTLNYRLGVNHDKIDVNCPKYAKTYVRDGNAPVNDNMGDAPNYYPNSFSGPMPYVDEDRPKERLAAYESSAVDLQPAANFYNYYVADESHRQRLAKNAAESLATVTPPVLNRALKLLTLIDYDLGKRVTTALPEARAEKAKY